MLWILQAFQAKRLNFQILHYTFLVSFFGPSAFLFPVEWCYHLLNLQYTIFCKYCVYLSTSLLNYLLEWIEMNTVEYTWFLPSSLSRHCVFRHCSSLLVMAVCIVVSAMGFTDVIFLISKNTLCVSPSLRLLLGVLVISKQYTFDPLQEKLF
jgi:hypothetical protein